MTFSQKLFAQSHALNQATLIEVVRVFLKYTHQRKFFKISPSKFWK